MASIGEVSIVLSASVEKMTRALDQTTRRMEAMQREGRRLSDSMEAAGDKIGRAFGRARAAIIAAGTAVATWLASRALTDAARQVDEIGKAAKRLGASVEEMSILRFAAKQSGVEFDRLAKLAADAGRRVAEIVERGQTRVALGRYSVQLTDVNGHVRSIVELLPDLAAGIGSAGSAAERLNLARKFFGERGGVEFVQLINEMGDGLASLTVHADRARRLGVVFDEETFRRLRAYVDAVDRIKEAWLGLRVAIAEKVAPVLTEIADKIANAMAAIPEALGRVIEVLRQAKDDPRIREALAALGQRMVEIFEAVGFGAGLLLIASLRDSILAGAPLLVRTMGLLAEEMVDGFYRSWGRFLEKIGEEFAQSGVPGHGTIGSALIEFGRRTRVAAEAREAFRGDREFILAFTQNLPEFRATSEAFNLALSNIVSKMRLFGEEADELFRLSDLFREGSSQAREMGEGLKDAAAGVSGLRDAWNMFRDGAKSALKDLQVEAEQFDVLGRKITDTFTRGVAGGLAKALASGEASFRNFGKVALEVLNNVLQRLAEMVIEFMLLRAISGIFGSFGGGGAAKGEPATTDASGGAVLGDVPTHDVTLERMLMGARGPLGGSIQPRGAGGGMGGTTVQIIDQRGIGARPEVSVRTGPDGRRMLSVLIRDEVQNLFGSGHFDRALAATYGIQRVGAPR